ncbi:MAG: hypothetical protein MUF42_12220, partial [Cytophagaceae bacterium]|nr:hypothetical protein [Cytophagaceae bacterium]
MITLENYFETVDSKTLKGLPQTLKESHHFLLEKTANGESWQQYQTDPATREVIDLHLQKLNEQLCQAASSIQTNTKDCDCTMEGLQTTTSGDFEELADSGNMGSLNGKEQTSSRMPTKDQIKQARKILSGQIAKARKKVKSQKKLERLSEDVKFIRRVVAFHGKERSVGSLLPLIKTLHKLMLEKKISKKSRYASVIMMLQEKLLSIYNSYPESTMTIFRIPEDKLVKLVRIAGGETVYKSIGLIKAFISLQGKKMDRAKAKALYEKVYKSKVSSDDPYIGKLKSILEQLTAVIKGESVKFRAQELRGLEGIAKSYKSSIGSTTKIPLNELSMKEKMARLRAMRKGNGKRIEHSLVSTTNKTVNGLSGIMTA